MGVCDPIRALWSGSSRMALFLFVTGYSCCSRLVTTSTCRCTVSIDDPALSLPTSTQLWNRRVSGPSLSPRRARTHRSACSRKRYEAGITPTTVDATLMSENVSVWPIASLALPKRRRANPSLTMTTSGPPTRPSSEVNHRPATGLTPSVGNRS